MTALIPVPFTVTRYRCPVPQCGHTGSSKARIADHIARCWLNPEARACKTCAHYLPYRGEPDVGYVSEEGCAAGLPFPEDSSGRPTLAIDCPKWEPEDHPIEGRHADTLTPGTAVRSYPYSKEEGQ